MKGRGWMILAGLMALEVAFTWVNRRHGLTWLVHLELLLLPVLLGLLLAVSRGRWRWVWSTLVLAALVNVVWPAGHRDPEIVVNKTSRDLEVASLRLPWGWDRLRVPNRRTGTARLLKAITASAAWREPKTTAGRA